MNYIKQLKIFADWDRKHVFLPNLEPLLVDHFAGIEGAHGVNLHHSFEGVEGEGRCWAQEVASCIFFEVIQTHI